MAGGGAGRSFEEVLAELRKVHTEALASQHVQHELQLDVLRRENTMRDEALARQHAQHELQLDELRRENELLRSRLVDAEGLAASAVVPSRGSETTVVHSGEAGNDAEADVGLASTPGAPLPAANPAAPAAGAADAVPGAPAPTDAGPTVVGPPPRAGAGLCWLWEVIGGEGKGGLLVRDGESLLSPQLPNRLCLGSMVRGIKLNGDRLHFKRLAGVGPEEGWISTKFQGKDLVVKVCQVPLEPRLPPPMAVGLNDEEPLPVVLFFQDMVHMNMASALYQAMPEMKEMLHKAWPVISSYLFTDSNMEMAVLRGALAVFISIFAGLERLKVQRPEVLRRASAMAGIGNGQYIALCAAGVLSFEDGLKLLLSRQKALGSALLRTREHCTMVVDGLEQELLTPICFQACKTVGAGAVCKITAYISRDCFWVGGTSLALSIVRKEAVKAGGKVSGLRFHAPHTPLMRSFQTEFVATLDEVLPRMTPPLHTVWMNPTAVPMRPGCDPREIVAYLKHEMEKPMLLQQCADAMQEEGLCKAYHFQVSKRTWVPIGLGDLAEWFGRGVPYEEMVQQWGEGLTTQ